MVFYLVNQTKECGSSITGGCRVDSNHTKVLSCLTVQRVASGFDWFKLNLLLREKVILSLLRFGGKWILLNNFDHGYRYLKIKIVINSLFLLLSLKYFC